ncbi:zinc-ribbon domain-containing protein [Adlercreutzia equolifaciens]|uniref:zinc ribbon domain-containing protein n=1 Tax=Adlercreutzia equolifaciens TaxID=446660 RepID=UPI003A4E0CDA
MFCTKCGSQVSEGSKFCAKCGMPVGAAAAASPGQVVSRSGARLSPRNARLAAIVAAAAIAVAGASFAIWAVFSPPTTLTRTAFPIRF